MLHDADLILTLTGGLVAAMVMGLAAHRVGVSPIVGYLAAGVIVGPFTPGFVANTHIAEQLAELGVALLMFGVGLHFRAQDLLAVRGVALPGAAVQIGVATGLGMLAAHAFGWEAPAGIVFGVAISVASTVVLTRVLADNDALDTPGGHVAVGWLIVEDLFTVVVLVLMPTLASAEETTPLAIASALGIALVKLTALVAFTMLIGRRALPWLLTRVARTGSRELFTLAVLALALGIAAGSSLVFGASMALGAFLAGMVIGQSEFSTRAASDALPMRDAFAVLFFVSVGMLFDPVALPANLGPILATLAIVLLAKPAAAYVVVRLLKRPPRTAHTVALALAQIGEFSFIVSVLGTSLGLLPPATTQVLVVVSIVSIALNPIAFRVLLPRLVAHSQQSGHEVGSGPPLEPHAIVVGYGAIGRNLTRLLAENGVTPTVIELNLDTVRELRAEGAHAVYGDASSLEVLEHAGARTARALLVAGSGTPPDAVIRAARTLNPNIRVIARSTHVSDGSRARDAGADVVITAEAEVALAMTEVLLEGLGVTEERLDRARESVRSDLHARFLTSAA